MALLKKFMAVRCCACKWSLLPIFNARAGSKNRTRRAARHLLYGWYDSIMPMLPAHVRLSRRSNRAPGHWYNRARGCSQSQYWAIIR